MTRLPVIALLSAGLLAGAMGDAHAQAFQWPSWLGGPRQDAPPAPAPGTGGPAAPEAPPAGPVVPASPPPARPVAAKAISDDKAIGQDLRLNGGAGTLRITRAGAELKGRISLAGTRLSRPGETCTVERDALTVTHSGRPDGLTRWEIGVPSCTLSASVLDGALWVREPAQCTIEVADCRVEPGGIWGPDAAALRTQAGAIERDRGQADRALRDNFRVLSQRAGPGEVRAVVSEQAAFSAERETVCRNYRGEANHGFCNARYTEGRAAQLAARLGIGPGAPTAAAPPVQRRPVAGPPAGAPLPLGPQPQ